MKSPKDIRGIQAEKTGIQAEKGGFRRKKADSGGKNADSGRLCLKILEEFGGQAGFHAENSAFGLKGGPFFGFCFTILFGFLVFSGISRFSTKWASGGFWSLGRNF